MSLELESDLVGPRKMIRKYFFRVVRPAPFGFPAHQAEAEGS